MAKIPTSTSEKKTDTPAPIPEKPIPLLWKTVLAHPNEMAAAIIREEEGGYDLKHIVTCGHTYEHAAYFKRSL